MWCVSPPIQISQISQIPQISFEIFHGIPRKIIHCKLPKPAKPPTKYMQRELRKAQQLPQLAEEQQRRSPTFQDATRCDRKHKYMDYIMDYIYICDTCYFSLFSIYVFVFWHTVQMAELPYLSHLKTPYVSYVSVQASSISLLPTWSSNESCPL